MDFSAEDICREQCNSCQRLDLLNMINDALILSKAHGGKILFMNQKALEMYQYTEEESLTLSFANISHESLALMRENAQSAKRYAKGYIFTTNHVKKDGSIFKVEVSTRYMSFHGEMVFASVVRNLTTSLKMQAEVELAGKIQRRLLPRDLDEESFRICSIYHPYNYVSGDLYDFIYDDEKKVLVGILIDVMGHGVSTAFQTGILKYLFTRAIAQSIPINEKMAWINKEVMRFFAGGGFAGVLLFEFDYKCNTLTYSAGGINHFIIHNSQGATVIKTPGLFLGINETEVFEQGMYRFTSGESFLFLTDGLFELLAQPIPNDIDFWETLKGIIAKGDFRDDASGLGVLIR